MACKVVLAVQALHEKAVSVEDFVGHGLLSLCLRALAAPDEGFR